jgi:predicted CopG family antitoxin
MTTSVIDSVTNDSSQETTNTASDILSELVGEGKKFKDIQALAASKREADQFIEQIKRENAELREVTKALEAEKTTQHSLTEILAALKQDKKEEGGNQSPVSLEELTKLVKSVTSQEREMGIRTANRDLVDKTLITKFGDQGKAIEAVKTKAKELGLGPYQIKELSESSPAAFLQLFGATASGTNQASSSTVKGNVNSESMNLLPDGGERNFAYYEALRKKMGSQKYFADYRLQTQKQRDMAALGTKFIPT